MRLIFLFVLLLAVFPIVAQTEEPQPETPPLLQMLALVPETANTLENYTSFSDFRASESARPTAGQYEAWAEFEAANEGTEEEQLEARLWLNSMLAYGAPRLAPYLLSEGHRYPEVMGFDFFDIDSALSFGVPPTDGQIFMGDFDADAIDAARTAREFEATEIEGLTAWCSPDGCDAGSKVNVSDRDPADVFGGDLGRKQPSVLADSFLFSSADLTTVEAIAGAYNGDQESLAENPVYVAAAEAITQEGLLRQAILISPLMIFPGDVTNMLEGTPAAELEPLPVYELLVLADMATEEEQRAVIALVYSDEQNAETAAEVIPSRLETAESLRMRRSFADLIEDRGMTMQDPELYTSTDGKTVVVFEFSYAPAPDTPDENGRLTQTGIGFRLFFEAFTSRDMNWLVP